MRWKSSLAALGLACVAAAAGWTAGRAQGPPAEPPPAAALPANPLADLDWLVGDWVDRDDQVSIETACHWTKNNQFLLRSFRVITAKGVHLSGMQLIGWDPANRRVRSWTFDSDGGFGEETWSRSGDRWTIRARHTLASGQVATAVNTLTYVNDDTFTWRSVNREVGGAFQPDIDEVTVVRRAAAASIVPKKEGGQP